MPARDSSVLAELTSAIEREQLTANRATAKVVVKGKLAFESLQLFLHLLERLDAFLVEVATHGLHLPLTGMTSRHCKMCTLGHLRHGSRLRAADLVP